MISVALKVAAFRVLVSRTVTQGEGCSCSIQYYFRCKQKITCRRLSPSISVKKMLDKEADTEKSVEKATEHDFAKPEMQEARAFLRERFLRVVTGIVGKRAEFHLHENSKVAGEFRGCDVDGLEIYVRNLETPLGKLPETILRTSDVIYFNVDEVTAQQ